MKVYSKSLLSPRRLAALLEAIFITTLLLANLAGPAYGQSTSIRFDTLSVENGLSQSAVRAIFQDAQGFMWFGTDNGLNKYDGYSFTVYKHDVENPNSLLDNMVTAIFQDSYGDLWFGTASGLDRFNRTTETFQHFQYEAKNPQSLRGTSVSAIMEDQQRNLWVGTSEGGLSRFNRSAGNFTTYLNNPGNPNSLSNDNVLALLADSKNGLWIGTYDGLDYLDLKTGRFTHYRNDPNNPSSLSDNKVTSLFLNRQGLLWVGTEGGGVNRFNPADGVFTRYQNRPTNPYSLSNDIVLAVYEDQNGHMWVGGRGGLNRFNREDESFARFQHDPNDLHSLSNDYVLSIFADRSGVLWVGTFGGGLSKYVQNNERFNLYQHRPNVPNSLSNDVVYAIREDKKNAVWVGTMDGGLNRMDPEANTFYVYQNNPSDQTSLSSNDVRAIFEDRMGILWVGTYGGGLNRFNEDTNRFTHFVHNDNDPNSLSDNRVMAIYEDRRGNLWIGTRGGGLDLLDRDTGHFTHFRQNPNDPGSLSGDFVRTIYEDRYGNLWVGTYNGISVMNATTHTFIRYQNEPNNPRSLSSDRVLSILETSDGIIWVGTLLGGLNRFNPNTQSFRHYTQKQGLPSDAVYGILADRNGYLWLSTSRGLSRFDPRTDTFRNYDQRDGLQSFEFSPGAYYENSRGRMYFGGIQGFNFFDPTKIQDNPLPPQVIITAFKKFNQTEQKDLPKKDKITLSYQENFISFEFAALDYGAPEKNQYAYKLEGFDKEWVYAGTRRYASYTNLRGGKYTFRVIGSNQDGIWNETGASVEIIVIPPIWERWWFIGAVAAILLGSSYGGYRLRLMRMQAQTRYLEEQIHERTQEIERRREVAEGLREILNILNSDRSLKESLDAIIEQAIRLMEARAVVIFRCSDEGPMVVASNLMGTDGRGNGRSVLFLPGWITQPIIEGHNLIRPNLLEERHSHPEFEQDPYGQYGALLAAPAVVNDSTDGGLALFYDQPREFSEEDIQMAMSFADHTALAIANAQLRSQAEEIAVSAERSRLARDLHDAVTQTLFATSLIAEVLPRLWDRNPEAGKQKITEIRELTRGALAEMRTLLMELRPTALVDVPLTDLLQQLSEAFTGRARVPVALDIEHPVDLPANVKIGFYRIAQEALNNIQKHARATQVQIRLCEVDSRVEMSIYDNGTGFETGKKLPDHFGLGIMEERAQTIGAKFTLESHPGKGTSISIAWVEE